MAVAADRIGVPFIVRSSALLRPSSRAARGPGDGVGAETGDVGELLGGGVIKRGERREPGHDGGGARADQDGEQVEGGEVGGLAGEEPSIEIDVVGAEHMHLLLLSWLAGLNEFALLADGLGSA
jgi:hypothetical protein